MAHYLYTLDDLHGREPDPETLGGKGANLAIMANVLDLPVPPAFVITTDAFVSWRKDKSIAFMHEEIARGIGWLEGRMDRQFGAKDNPLLVSVRSGAPVSMPGMMDTILDVGACADTMPGLCRMLGKNAATDALRRFEAMFTDSVGVKPSGNPVSDLHTAVEAVFRSTESARASLYRDRGGITEAKTAVVIQAMVFGTAPGFSGTGVAFTRNPSTGENLPVGDWLQNAQGEDVVSGTAVTKPLTCLIQDAPSTWEDMQRIFATLEKHFDDMCDIEFTIEAGRLWLLQTRIAKRTAQAQLRVAVEQALSPQSAMTRDDVLRQVEVDVLAKLLEVGQNDGNTVATGIPASPGIVSGRVYFSADAAVDAADRGEQVVLVRTATSPDDIHGMDVAVGIVTRFGGLLSHAAIIAREWGKAAVVGVETLEIDITNCRIGGHYVSQGDVITVNGTAGTISIGQPDGTHAAADNPAFNLLTSWAREISGLENAQALDAIAAAKAQLADNTHCA